MVSGAGTAISRRNFKSAGQSAIRLRMKPGLSIVIPLYNEARGLASLHEQLAAAARALGGARALAVEVIYVDDGSRDNSLEIARGLPADALDVQVVALSRNFGKEAALGAGLDSARGDVVFTLDADLQHPVELLPQMLQAWREGADMVYAVRRDRRGESAIKRIGTRLFYALMKLGSSIEIPPNAGDFRLLDRCVVDAVCSLPERTRFMKGLYAWVGFRSRSIDFDPPARLRGHSGFGIRALLSLAASGITAFSNLPLRLGSALGTLLALVAIELVATVSPSPATSCAAMCRPKPSSGEPSSRRIACSLR